MGLLPLKVGLQLLPVVQQLHKVLSKPTQYGQTDSPSTSWEETCRGARYHTQIKGYAPIIINAAPKSGVSVGTTSSCGLPVLVLLWKHAQICLCAIWCFCFRRLPVFVVVPWTLRIKRPGLLDSLYSSIHLGVFVPPHNKAVVLQPASANVNPCCCWKWCSCAPFLPPPAASFCCLPGDEEDAHGCTVSCGRSRLRISAWLSSPVDRSGFFWSGWLCGSRRTGDETRVFTWVRGKEGGEGRVESADLPLSTLRAEGSLSQEWTCT